MAKAWGNCYPPYNTDDEDTAPMHQTVASEEPENNDGRKNCYWCGAKTRRVDTGMFRVYDVCQKCGK